MQGIYEEIQMRKSPIVVVGLGYVGLPLATLFASKFSVVGLDINSKRVEELKSGHDRTKEVEDRARLINPNISYTTNPDIIKQSKLVIVTVPTPVDEYKKPDLRPLLSASEAIGKHIAKGTIVVFESTVYPGLTEEICGAKIAEISGLKAGIDFHLGYSPERVNPGDKKHTIDKITKIVSGDTPEVTNLLSKVYGSVITAGIFSAASIKVAEAAKVIENTQRDINIALINELSQIFDRIGIDTLDVLQASGTKWNFLPFRPGLVGGHCIGVDPYYLTYVAEKLGIHPEVILAGRRINDNMAAFVAQKTIKLVLSSPKFDQEKLRIGILGVTFKENVPDLRNSKVADLVNEFKSYGADVDIFDPMVDEEELKHEYNLRLTKFEEFQPCHALVLAVPHTEFIECYPLEKLLAKTRNTRVLIDIKGALNRTSTQAEGVTIWRP